MKKSGRVWRSRV